MTLPLLPMEIINKILIMREPHTIAKLLKTSIEKYNKYVNFFQAMCYENYELYIEFKKVLVIINLNYI